MSGYASGIVQSMFETELRPGLRIGGNAARVVIGDARDQTWPNARKRMLFQSTPSTFEEAGAELINLTGRSVGHVAFTRHPQAFQDATY
ncbi:hypothetical protein [Sphingomonas sp. PL20]|uniref:hypothetical protein n=1 Tax=Sphingomonas sp. PL20 TaxID=2760712 RepID=UPI002FEECBA8